jgi:hypothetical protein
MVQETNGGGVTNSFFRERERDTEREREREREREKRNKLEMFVSRYF